jgi:hypothetical protein
MVDMLPAPALSTSSSESHSPYLSVVACSRNDGHGENLIERMQLFIDGIAEQAARFHLDSELILVDWNPPTGKPGLADVLRYPDGAGYLTSRVVTVPQSVHARLRHSDALPLFQMIAKNVGIRRARGRMVLSTNVDILFSDALFAWIAARDMDEQALYRVDRADIKVPFGASEAGHPPWVRALPPLRVSRRDGIYDSAGNRVLPIYTGLADLARYRWAQIRQPERTREMRPAKPVVATSNLSSKATRSAEKVWRLVTCRTPHLNACGDFTLLSRSNWFLLGGHAEWPMYSWNLDSLLLYQARAHGIREIDLPSRFTVLHMDHAKGSGWTPDGAGALFSRVAARGIPILTDDQLDREVRRLGLTVLRRPRPHTYTGADWGYADVRLDERSFPASGSRSPRRRTTHT